MTSPTIGIAADRPPAEAARTCSSTAFVTLDRRRAPRESGRPALGARADEPAQGGAARPGQDETARQGSATSAPCSTISPFRSGSKDTESRLADSQQGAGRRLNTTVDALIGQSDRDVSPAELAERYRADDCAGDGLAATRWLSNRSTSMATWCGTNLRRRWSTRMATCSARLASAQDISAAQVIGPERPCACVIRRCRPDRWRNTAPGAGP